MFIAAATAAKTKPTKFTSICLLVIVTVLILDKCIIVEARYLPTRSNGDRIDKLRELLKDLLESEIERDEYEPEAAPPPPRWRPGSKLFYKREAPTPFD